MGTQSIRDSIEDPWSKDSDRETCCGIFSLDAGVVFIGLFMIVTTGFFTLLGIYYAHFIFFAPLIGVLGLYCIFFIGHKVIPGKDNIDSRRALFFLMVMITLATLGYGILFANELFNEVPKEMCEQQVHMDKKACREWCTGLPGNFAVLLFTVMNLYFSYIHLEYLNELTLKGDHIEFTDEPTDPNNPY